MNLMALWPTAHAAAVLAALAVAVTRPAWRGTGATLAVALLYLLPPLVARLASVRSLKPGRFDPETKAGRSALLRWWWTAQVQTLFLRFPALEELLRLLPFGIYSAWLRLWGSRVGRLVYWAPGTVVLDRGLIDIGDHVVFGAGARLHPHVVIPEAGRLILLLGPVTIGAGCLVGGFSLLLPGVTVEPGTVSPPFRHLRPFQTWPGRAATHDFTRSETPTPELIP
jgi:acetyltransferase-like isoleucine patch superfamily enzyme